MDIHRVTVGPGFVGSSCQFPQITGEGLEEAITHGRDLRQVYASRSGLSTSVCGSIRGRFRFVRNRPIYSSSPLLPLMPPRRNKQCDNIPSRIRAWSFPLHNQRSGTNPIINLRLPRAYLLLPQSLLSKSRLYNWREWAGMARPFGTGETSISAIG